MADTAQKLANPAPLGLVAFGLTTVLLSLINAGVLPKTGESVVIPLAMAYGGTIQILVGLLEFKAGNTFGMTAFLSYGAFWWWFALLLILGSSPMVEGIPAFFAAGKYGVGLIVVMSLVFAFTTIATYVVLCVYSTAGLQRVRLGPLERFGEVLSGCFIALVGMAFWLWPVL